MADDVLKPATDKPLASLAAAETKTEQPDPPREVPATERLRAFEDEHFGKDAVRVAGHVERGSGSIYQQMSTELKRQYAALENLVVAERQLTEAEAALVLAETQHAAALAAAEPPRE